MRPSRYSPCGVLTVLALFAASGQAYAQAPAPSAAPGSSSSSGPAAGATSAVPNASDEGTPAAASAARPAPFGAAAPLAPSGQGPALGPSTLIVDDAQSVPHGYRVETQPRMGLITAGAVGFGVGWLSTLVYGGVCYPFSEGTEIECSPLFFPLAGPFVFVGLNSSLDPVWAVLTSISGVVQITGATTTIIGLLLPEKKLVRQDVNAPQATVVPMIGQQTLGLSLVGTF